MKDEELVLSIVKVLIRDVYGRYGFEQMFRGGDPRIMVSLYERWMELISDELYKTGKVTEKYIPLNVDDMSFAEVIRRIDFFVRPKEAPGY